MSGAGSGTVAIPSPAGIFHLERAWLDDAARLAELWAAALRASFQLGYDTGHRRGVLTGRHEEATAWQAIVTGYSAVLDAPTRAELARVRRPSNDACARRCGSCSQCIRAAVVLRNLEHYGVPDFPGISTAQIRHGRRRS